MVTLSRIFVTGDIHGKADLIGYKHFPQGRGLSKDDYVIIAGDFGFPWLMDKSEDFWLNWLDTRPWTTLFIDGNHENFDRLEELTLQDWKGGKVRQVRESVLHLTRGQIFNLSGRTFFTFGGASSVDIERRKEGVSYWKRELPSEREYEEGVAALDRIGWSVDVVLTHTCPAGVLSLFPDSLHKVKKEIDPVNLYLQGVQDKLRYQKWFFGHFHKDYDFGTGMRMLYRDIVEV